MAENTAPVEQQPAAAPAANEPPVAKIISTREMERFVPLEWPIEFDGKLYDQVRVHRITGHELQAYVEALGSSGSKSPLPPTIDCPQEVWDVMDADDMDAVGIASMDFMPRRMKAAADQIPSSGDSTSGS